MIALLPEENRPIIMSKNVPMLGFMDHPHWPLMGKMMILNHQSCQGNAIFIKNVTEPFIFKDYLIWIEFFKSFALEIFNSIDHQNLKLKIQITTDL